jgi:beta-galactosidase
MKRTTFLLTLLLAMLTMPMMAQRQVIDFDFGWKFHLGDIDETKLASLGDVSSSWRTVDVPHDFQIEQPWVAPDKDEKASNSDGASNFRSRLSARGFKEMGSGWYVKTYTPGKELQGKRILIDFEGIMYVGDVYLNGVRIGGTDYGYVGFDIDLSDKLKYGEENVIAVKASTGDPMNSRWYTGGGLFRDVHLIVTDASMYFVRHPLYITTKDNHEVDIQAEVANLTRNNDVSIGTKIIDAQGTTVYEKKADVHFNRKMKTNELKLAPVDMPNPRLWSCEDPYLYTAEVTLYDSKGNVVDQASSRFGMRTIEFSPAFGFRLNGKKVLLKGIANHHTLGALGAAAYPRAMEKRLKLLKEFGFNHVRTSHNPYSESFLNLCDEMGILVVDELYDKWLDQYTGGRKPWLQIWPYDLPEWVKRDRNHPSVVVWSLGNELQTYPNLPFGDWGVTPYRMMKPVLQRYDNTRPITVAMHPRGRSLETDSLPAPLVYETDIAAYNYRYMYFNGDGRRFPKMMFYQSEANTSDMGPNFFGMNLDKVLGLAYWGQIDYLGESQGWPAKGWQQGAFDMSLQPKPMAYLLKSMFSDEPTVHIGIINGQSKNTVWNGVQVGTTSMSENWNLPSGSVVSLYTYTNGDKVELFVNGKSLGVKENSADPKTRDQIKWDGIHFEPGYIEAVAYKAGKVIARHRIETTGEAVKLKVTPDVEQWKADGQDLQHVRVLAVDSKGRRVLSANQPLTFSVDGDARIVAVDNGNITSDELMATDHRNLFCGSALVIIRAGQKPGNVTLSVSSPGYKTVKTKLKCN